MEYGIAFWGNSAENESVQTAKESNLINDGEQEQDIMLTSIPTTRDTDVAFSVNFFSDEISDSKPRILYN